MAAEQRMVAGRKFGTKADYEAALRDAGKIEEIRKKVNFDDPRAVMSLYEEMQADGYRFETMVGNDFDDTVFELVEKYKKEGLEAGSGKKKKKERKKGGRKGKAPVPVSTDELNGELRREVERQLRIRDRRRKLIVGLCSFVALLCLGYFAAYCFYAERTGADYEQLARLKDSDALSGDRPIVIKGREEEVELPDILDEYKTLYNKNKKLIGWLKIDDTIIDYPVMQTSNNDYYLTYNFNQEYDKNGSIFMDYQCSAYPRSQNLILYGHHMKSGKMFGDLEKYADASYAEKHGELQFDTIYEKSAYQVMYVFRTKVLKKNEIAFKYYQFIDAGSEEEFNSYMKEMADMSLYDTGVTASYGDELLTLSTCDHSQTDGRFAVVAKRIR